MTQTFASGIPATNGAADPATCDTDTLETSTGPVQLRADFTPEVINLKWYNGDTRVNVATASNSCTYDTAISLPTNPTKPGYKFKGWNIIPGTRVEYIQSTGTQWIDTGIIVKSNTLADFEYQYTSIDGQNFVFGQIAGSPGRILGYRSSNPWWFSIIYSENIALDTLKHHVEYKSDGRAYLDGIAILTRGEYAGQYDITMLLFAERNDTHQGSYSYNINGFIINAGRVKIYNFKIKEGDVLVRDYIPIKDYNGVACMYDLVTKQIFYNSGSGDFIAGPDL